MSALLLREQPDGVLAIGQASHAWLSGQLARAWGDAHFGAVWPYEEVCLAAEQHDVGMARWDLEPTLNHGTGLPHSFIEMPIDTHLELWRTGPSRLVTQSRYAALLVAMHGRRLYQRRDLDKLPPDHADAVRGFIEGQHELEQRLLATLRSDPATAWLADGTLLARNSQLVWIWDFLSLALCLDWAPCTARAVPTETGQTDIELVVDGESGRTTLDPWPFSAPSVRLRAEGRLLAGRFATEAEMRQALVRAPWRTVEIELVPAGGSTTPPA